MKRLFKFNKKTATVGLAFGLAIGASGVAIAFWTSSGSGTGSATNATATALTITQDGTPVYNSTISPLPGSMPSQGFQSSQISQFGNEIKLANYSATPLTSAVVTMEDWACQNWAAMNADPTVACTTTPGATFAQPITLAMYADAGGGAIGTLLGYVTQTFNIPFRPSWNSGCGPVSDGYGDGGEWYNDAATAALFNVTADNACHHGLANNITFNLTSLSLSPPSTFIYGISFNTQTYGSAPTGIPGPYNSLNVALSTTPTNPSVGSDTYPGQLDMNSATAGNYCDGTTTNLFRLDSAGTNPAACTSPSGGWSVSGTPTGGAPYYLPAVEFNVGTTSGLYPGGPALPINFSVTNPGTIPQALNNVIIAISSITNLHTSTGPACGTGDYALVQPGAINGTVGAGATYDDSPSGASIQLINQAWNQDSCQGAIVHLTFTSN